MSTARLMTYAVVGLFLSRALFADDARYEGGDGHLALLTDGEADWKVLRISDAVASKGRVRTSPIGMIRIRLSDGLLLLGADTEADLDTEGRSVVLRRGRLRLIVNDATQGEWQAQCNQHVASCPAGSELAIATSTDRPAIHLLRGRARLKSANQERGSFTAPAMDLANEAKRPEPPKPPAANEWAQSIRAATERHFATAPGQLMISDLQSGNPIRLQVARLHVNVVLRPPLALVQIDQSFLNPYPVSKDGVFSINLPAGGSVCRFAATTVQRNLMEAEIFDSAQRQELYPPGIGYRPRPERTGDNTLRMHVSPVPANDSMRIVVDYTVPLVAQSGEYRFDLPLADQKTISDVTLSGTIHSPVNAPAVISVTHPDLKFAARPDNSVSFRTSQKNVAPACFSLRYPAPQDPPPIAKSYQSATDADQYFVVTVPAAMNPVKFKPSDPADVLLLVETSGHARNLARAQLAARTVAANLRAVDRLKIGCVDVTYRPLTRDWCQSNSSEVLAAIQQLQEQFPLGGSDVESTLRQSLAAFKDSATGRRDRKSVV